MPTASNLRRPKLVMALVIVLAAGLTVFGWVRFSPQRPRINRSSYAKIRPGMTLEEIESQMGSPAGTRTESEVGFDPHLYVEDAKARFPAVADCRYGSWAGNCAVVVVQFGPDGKVAAAEYQNIGKVSFRDRIWYWIGW
jgi:hypothetical protein